MKWVKKHKGHGGHNRSNMLLELLKERENDRDNQNIVAENLSELIKDKNNPRSPKNLKQDKKKTKKQNPSTQTYHSDTEQK